MKKFVVSLALCLLAAPALAQEPEVRTTPIKGSLYLLQGRGGNVLASVGDDGVLLIDSDYSNYAPAYQKALIALGDAGARFLINTHWHGDHTGSNAYWGESGTVIVAQDNVRARMSTRQENKLFGSVTEPSPMAAVPLVTFADSLALHFNGDTLEVQHYPNGHTDGDSVVFFVQADVVHMGDHYFKDRFPFVDASSGGNVSGFIANVEAVLGRVGAQTIIIPGHGGVANRADLQRYLQMLKATHGEVEAMRAEGLDLAAMQARGLDKQWASWGSGFIDQVKWISFLQSNP